jgi:hypothetical protein
MRRISPILVAAVLCFIASSSAYAAMMHSQITEEDVRSGESRCKITVEKAEGGAVKFRFVISDEKQNFPYLFDVALGDVIIIGNGGNFRRGFADSFV